MAYNRYGSLIGVVPNYLKRVAICPNGCDFMGPYGFREVAEDALTFTCLCGAVVDTVIVNVETYRVDVEERDREEFLDYADLMQASFCESMQPDPDEDEE